MASVTLDVPGKREGHLPSFLHLYHQLPPLEASPTDTPSFSPTQYLGSRCEYTYFTGDMPRAQGTKYQPGSCCWFPDSEDVQAAPGWAHSPLKQNFLCRLPFSLPHYIHLEGGWVSLFLFGFCEKRHANSAFCGQKVDTADTPAQLRVSLPKGGSEDRGGSGELCCPS